MRFDMEYTLLKLMILAWLIKFKRIQKVIVIER